MTQSIQEIIPLLWKTNERQVNLSFRLLRISSSRLPVQQGGNNSLNGTNKKIKIMSRHHMLPPALSFCPSVILGKIPQLFAEDIFIKNGLKRCLCSTAAKQTNKTVTGRDLELECILLSPHNPACVGEDRQRRPEQQN